jgi:hypothetical protein
VGGPRVRYRHAGADLHHSLKDGTMTADVKDSIEVALLSGEIGQLVRVFVSLFGFGLKNDDT